MTNHPNRSRQANMVAIYQSGYAIFGVGKTTEQALADANKWLDEPISEGDLGRGDVDGEMCEIEITPELFAAVRERGGDIAIAEMPERGVYGTYAQADAAWAAKE